MSDGALDAERQAHLDPNAWAEPDTVAEEQIAELRERLRIARRYAKEGRKARRDNARLRTENERLGRELDERDGMDWLLDRWLHLYPASIADFAEPAVQEPIREACTAMAKLRIALDEHRAARRQLNPNDT